MKQELAINLRVMVNSLDKFANDKLTSKYKIDFTQYTILSVLANSDRLTQQQIVTESGLSKGMISKLVTSMKNRKLLKTAGDKGDRRVNYVSLSVAGKKVYSNASSLLESELKNVIGKKVKVADWKTIETVASSLIDIFRDAD